MKIQVDDKLEGGDEDYILAEVDQSDVGEPVRLAGNEASGNAVVRAQETLARSFDRLGPALSTMLAKLRAAEHAPDTIEMEFGLKLGGEAGLIFARGTAEANFTVTVTWAKPASASESVGTSGSSAGDELGVGR